MSESTRNPPPESQMDLAAEFVRSAERVTVLTGAGVSAESGIATFRGSDGLWYGNRIEDVATPRAFRRDPALVWRFYNMRRESRRDAKPNPGHFALAEMEQILGFERFTLVTQNVDGLHQQAGSQHVLEIHGSISRVRCTGCEKRADRGLESLPELPKCVDCGALLRPDIVWFEEALPEDVWSEAVRAASMCECFLIVGTSAVVYPAAGLLHCARNEGAKIIEINIERTDASKLADVGLYAPSGQALPELVSRLNRPV